MNKKALLTIPLSFLIGYYGCSSSPSDKETKPGTESSVTKTYTLEESLKKEVGEKYKIDTSTYSASREKYQSNNLPNLPFDFNNSVSNPEYIIISDNQVENIFLFGYKNNRKFQEAHAYKDKTHEGVWNSDDLTFYEGKTTTYHV